MKPLTLHHINAVLIDLDGVLYIGNEMIDGADKSLNTLRKQGLKIAGLTNTTTQSRRAIANKLAAMGLPLSEADLYTPAILAKQHIAHHSARFFIRDALREDFIGIDEDVNHPDYIVMGDIGGEGYAPEDLCDIFRLVMEGAKLLALHKNRFWQKSDGLHLDLGVFVAAIEYASHKQAVVLGKPSKDFFHHVCHAIQSLPSHTCMVGDDIESDIGGAQQAGLIGILVQTGKYRTDFVRKSQIKPNYSISSIGNLYQLFSGQIS